jgi:hypothetical protein
MGTVLVDTAIAAGKGFSLNNLMADESSTWTRQVVFIKLQP